MGREHGGGEGEHARENPQRRGEGAEIPGRTGLGALSELRDQMIAAQNFNAEVARRADRRWLSTDAPPQITRVVNSLVRRMRTHEASTSEALWVSALFEAVAREQEKMSEKGTTMGEKKREQGASQRQGIDGNAAMEVVDMKNDLERGTYEEERGGTSHDVSPPKVIQREAAALSDAVLGPEDPVDEFNARTAETLTLKDRATIRAAEARQTLEETLPDDNTRDAVDELVKAEVDAATYGLALRMIYILVNHPQVSLSTVTEVWDGAELEEDL